MAIAGCTTDAGTARYRARHLPCHPDHFRRFQDVWGSSIGLGTYLGDATDVADALYAHSLEAALAAGCNLIDTAINYRCQRSERTIGSTLERLIRHGAVARDEVVLCTKGGYLPFDGAVPRDPNRYFTETFLTPGFVRPEELVAGCHCLSPSYLEHQLATSLANLRVETLDVYYLHNPEQQLEAVPRETFLSRMEAAFALLERKAKEGRIRWYGTATWTGYRANPNAAEHLSLQELVEIARRIGGEAHHFRVIQLPYNLAMPEALVFKSQLVNGAWMSPLEAAAALGLSVVISASLLQSRLTSLPAALTRLIEGPRTDAQRALQFVRSSPGVTSALVGMKRVEHVHENLELAGQPVLSSEQIDRVFARAKTPKPARR